MRIKFRKGQQRVFLDLVIKKLNAPSLRGLLQFGFDVPYSTLKNYYIETRLMPKDLVLNFCDLAEIDFKKLIIDEVPENWGKTLGGKIKKNESHSKKTNSIYKKPILMPEKHKGTPLKK